jgi:type II secretory pathway component PulF
MLDRVAIYKEKSELLKQKIKKAMKYPITVIVVAVIVTIILMVKVVLFSKISLVHLVQTYQHLPKWL